MSNHPDPAQIVNRRLKRANIRRRSSLTKLSHFGIGLVAVFSVLLVAAIIAAGFFYASLTTNLPNTEMLPVLLGQDGLLRQPTILVDRTGEHTLLTLENPNAESAGYLYLEVIPQHMVDAVIAMRDPDFWTHPGFTLDATTPSLAEELVIDLMLWQEPEGWRRDWRTRLLAAQATKTYGREAILEWYLNNAEFGQLAHGVDQAAWVYFKKPAKELNVAEAAILGAAVASPTLNPIDAPQIAAERQRQTLNAMIAFGYLSADQAARANQEAVFVQTTALPLPVQAGDFSTLALESLYQSIGRVRVQYGGFIATTSLDLELQAQADCAIQVQLSRLSGDLPLTSLGASDCETAALLPTFSSGSVIPGIPAEAGVVVLDPKTGEILALAGDALSLQQTGTTLSPFIYLTAFTRGMGPASLVWDIPASLPAEMEGYNNFDDTYHGPMRVRTAFSHDYVIPLSATLHQIGPMNAWRTAQQSGLFSLDPQSLSDSYAPLTTQGAFSLLSVTHAYSMLANQGTLMGAQTDTDDLAHTLPPLVVLEITNYDGRIWLSRETQFRPVTTPQLAFLVTDMLADAEARRESLGHPNPFEIGRPVAAKTGQSLNDNTTWAIGYTPDRVVGVRLNTASGEQLSPLIAAGLWHAVTKTAHQDIPASSFPEPIGITHRTVCDPSGLIPTEDCQKTVSEIFITGSEPIQADNLYRKIQVNTQTGRLATIYTPPEFVEEKVYLIVPPEAQEWAIQAGNEIPPDTYDVVFNPGAPSETVNITIPEIFSYVTGEVVIAGNAGGEDFAYYRVRVGKGLNPRQWLQIGQNVEQPVENGLLVNWDTGDLEGLYAIQLQVVDENQSVQTASIQVTVDNQPPVVEILHPTEGQTFSYPEEREITFQAQVTDNIGITRVEFWLDGVLLSRLADPPYAAPWRGFSGDHELEVRTTDLAGNQTIVTVEFIVSD